MQQIASQLGCSVNKVVYWMDKYGFDRRNWSEATYVYRNPDGDPFTITLPQTQEEWFLFGLGIGLYVGEGNKTGHNVCLANTDPRVQRAFIDFLGRFCGVQKKQLRAWLNIFDDCNIQSATTWWANELGFAREQFYSPHVRRAKNGSYTNKSVHGTLTVAFGNAKLLNIVNEWCATYCQ